VNWLDFLVLIALGLLAVLALGWSHSLWVNKHKDGDTP